MFKEDEFSGSLKAHRLGLEVEELDYESDHLPQEENAVPVEENDELTTEGTARGTDPVALYLREIGTVSLLRKDQEVTLGLQMEKGQQQFIETVLSSPVAIEFVLELGERIKTNELSPKDAVMNTDEMRSLLTKLPSASGS